MLSQEVQLLNHGKSEVHLTGYQTTTEMLDPEADLNSDEDDDLDMAIRVRFKRSRHHSLSVLSSMALAAFTWK